MANSSQDGGVIGKTGALEQLQAELRRRAALIDDGTNGMTRCSALAIERRDLADALSGPIAAQHELERELATQKQLYGQRSLAMDGMALRAQESAQTIRSLTAERDAAIAAQKRLLDAGDKLADMVRDVRAGIATDPIRAIDAAEAAWRKARADAT